MIRVRMPWQGLHGSVGEYCYKSEPYDQPHRKVNDDEHENEGKKVKEAPFKPASPPRKGGAGKPSPLSAGFHWACPQCDILCHICLSEWCNGTIGVAGINLGRNWKGICGEYTYVLDAGPKAKRKSKPL